MRRLSLCSIPLAFVLATACQAGPAEVAEDSEAETAVEGEVDVSYAIGWQTGLNFRQQEIDIDAEQFADGLREALAGGDSRWTAEEMGAALQAFQQELLAQQQEKMAAAGSENAAAGEAFLAENKDREGVMTTDSGLQYEVVEEGEGPSPSASDRVTVHYRGTLVDGTQFDSSIDRGQPATFRLDQVIAGWTEGLQLMNVGSKYKLYVPAELAYGPRGQGAIGPNSTLVFEVELIGIEGR